MTLYHGSKSGIVGPVRPTSRDCCDFGRGFYMGDFAHQPKTLICRSEAPWFYNFDEICERIASGAEWGYFIEDNAAVITSAPCDLAGAVTVPSQLGGCPVVSIGDWVGAELDEITSLTVRHEWNEHVI